MDGVKGIYFSLEEKYYNFLDKVNEKVPVYDVIDPIDRLAPSFIVFTFLFVAILALLLSSLLGGFFPGAANILNVSVLESNDNAPIAGVRVTFLKDGEVISTTSTDNLGIASQADVEIDDTIEVRSEKDGYLTETKSIIVFELPQGAEVRLQKESEAFTSKTIRLVDALGQPLADHFTMKFKCSDPYAPTISDISLQSSDRGVAQINVPSNCGRLTVDVSNSNKFREVIGQGILEADESIYLSEEEEDDATIAINVKDPGGKILDGIQVELYKYEEILENPNVGPIDVEITAAGIATFSKVPGKYIAKTYDAQGAFGEESSGIITAGSGETRNVDLTLVEEVKGKIKIKVVDKSSGSAIANAKVKLLFASNESELTTLNTPSDGETQFNISRDVEYKAVIIAEGYQLNRLSSLRINETASTVQLQKCTQATCGSLKVKIVDQDDVPISNATVTLYNAGTNFIAGYNTRTSDINGVAKFFGVSSGNYYAFAFREGFSGRSDAKVFDSGNAETGDAHLTVRMDVGEGSLKINARDREGRAIPFARVDLYDARTNQLLASDITDSNGIKEFIDFKANRKVYATVKKQDEQVYAIYTTAKKPLIVSTVQEFDTIIERPILTDNIEIQFTGLFDSGGLEAENVKAGETYTAKFKLRIPEEKDYESAGIHLRVGDDVLSEKDELVLKEVNAPKTTQVRATRFEPESSGLDESRYDVTAGDAKWVNLEWRNPLAGIYEIEAQIEIKNSASIGDRLPLYYRAWGEPDDDPKDRFPEDDTVTKELYSNTKQEVFQVGIVTFCDESFCFAATITDEENPSDQQDGLIESISDMYNAKIFNPYKLQFIITNNSTTRIHNRANLRVRNSDESIKFFDYKVTDAQTKDTRGTLNGFEFSRFNVGNLMPKNSIRFETEFTPQRAINGILNIQLVSDQQIVFEKNITVLISSPKELDVTIEPDVYLSGVQNDIEVVVTDRATGIEVENALVRLKDRKKNTLDFAKTRRDGKTTLTLPGQSPGDKITLEVEKIDYNVKLVELPISDKLLEITPTQLGIALNTKNKLQSEEKLQLRNITSYPLTIKDIRLSGTFRKILDTARVRNWLESSYKGITIEPDERQEIIVKGFLSQDALLLKKRETFNAELVIVAGNFGQEWVFKIPARIAVGLGDEVDNPACLVVTKTDWSVSTTGTSKRTEFQIQNNCTVSAKPVALQDLQAIINWKSNQIGEFSLNIGPDETVLRSGYSRLLLGSIQAEQTINAVLTFTPFGGINGSGDADIVIEASNPLDNEVQILQNTIKTKATSISISQCVVYDKERLVINQSETGAITVTATQNCGEPVDFEVESELSTSPSREFRLEPGKSQTIQIFSEKNYPGQYALYISPKFSSAKQEQLVKNLRVIVNAPGCWQLGKYEFDVYDSPQNQLDGFDVATLSNNCVEKPVTVKVDGKDFLDAAKDGLFWGLVSAGLVVLTNVGNPYNEKNQKIDWKGKVIDEQANGAKQAGGVKDIGKELSSIKRRNEQLRNSLEKARQQATKSANLLEHEEYLLSEAEIDAKLAENKAEQALLEKEIFENNAKFELAQSQKEAAATATQAAAADEQISILTRKQEELKAKAAKLSNDLDATTSYFENLIKDAGIEVIPTSTAPLGADPGLPQDPPRAPMIDFVEPLDAGYAGNSTSSTTAFGPKELPDGRFSSIGNGEWAWTTPDGRTLHGIIPADDPVAVELTRLGYQDLTVEDNIITPIREEPNNEQGTGLVPTSTNTAPVDTGPFNFPAGLDDGFYNSTPNGWIGTRTNGSSVVIAAGDLRANYLNSFNAKNLTIVNKQVEINSNPTPFLIPDEPPKTNTIVLEDGRYELRDSFGAKIWNYIIVDKDGKIVSRRILFDADPKKAYLDSFGRDLVIVEGGKVTNVPFSPQVVLSKGIPPAQGLLNAIAGNKNSGVGSGIAQGFGGGITSGILKSGAGIVRGIFGTSPWAAGALGAVVGGVMSYMSQPSEIKFTIVAKDTEIKDVKLVEGAAAKEQDYKNVQLTVQGLGKESDPATSPQPITNNPDLVSQGLEILRLVFENATGFVTSEDRPEYASVKVSGTRNKYPDKTYKKKDFLDETGGFLGVFDRSVVNPAKSNLTVEKTEKLEQRFRVEFNSVPPTTESSEDTTLLNCQDGTRIGKTGADAVPKIRFDWNWKDIKEDTCNEDNPNGVYCDATQFSIALLKKVNSLNEFLRSNGPGFACPSSLEDKPTKNDIGSFDIGIESISTIRNGTNVEMIAVVKNTNPGEIPVRVTLKALKPNNSGEILCPAGAQSVTVAAGGRGEVKCSFNNLQGGVYSARGEISPTVGCENCEDISATNSLGKSFFIGESGLEQCEPYSTTRLSEFLQASGRTDAKTVSNVKFNALLMADGYSNDFRHDFDIAQAESFFSAPDFYTNKESGLGVYFKDSSLFSFDAYSQPNFALPGPGTYSVEIDITYKNNSWNLFDSDQDPNATITVRMEKLRGAEPDSPLYYLPFNGLVGEKDGRIGYGINFAGDSIPIDNASTPRRTVEITGSSPIEDGTLNVAVSNNFKSMQVDERGVVVKISRAQGSPSLLFQPSNATPVILRIGKNTEEDAYAIYEPAIDGDAIDVGPQLALWNGIGGICRSFSDEVMSQQQFVPDTHGISTRCALVGQSPRSKYALEFCGKIVNQGTVFYETVFYTPQDSESYLKLVDVSSDSAELIGEGSSGSTVPLNGNGVTPKINSLEDVINLVKDEAMCISGTNLNAEFFWNPKKIFTALEDREEEAINACIAPIRRNEP